MKQIFIRDLISNLPRKNASFNLQCWIKKKRVYKNVIFLDVVDSTGTMQIVAGSDQMSETAFQSLKNVTNESCIEISCVYAKDTTSNSYNFLSKDYSVIGKWDLELQPGPRSDFDVFSQKKSDFLLKNRHLYIRNPKIMAILKYRHQMMGIVHEWYRKNGFIEITAPVLTKLPLYDDGSAVPLNIGDDDVYLTQCVGFYLESAVAAFEKVYNIGPSFRGEESRSKRHLMEYWHIKAEVAFANLEDGQKMIENQLRYIANDLLENGQDILKTLNAQPAIEILQTPYPKISYREAVELLNKNGQKFTFGKSLSSIEEGILSKKFNTPFWVVGIPKSLEPFPYVIDDKDTEVTKVSDLIAPRGYGELLGVAEKIFNASELEMRMKDKGKDNNANYKWVKELRNSGFFPHVGFGMGVERFIRYILGQEHVRDAIPFPRVFRRRIYP